MSADIKAFVTHVLQQGFCLDVITIYSPWYSSWAYVTEAARCPRQCERIDCGAGDSSGCGVSGVSMLSDDLAVYGTRMPAWPQGKCTLWADSAGPAATGSYRLLPAVIGNYRQLPAVTGRYRQVPAVTGSYRQLPAVTDSYRQLPAGTGSYRVTQQ